MMIGFEIMNLMKAYEYFMMKMIMMMLKCWLNLTCKYVRGQRGTCQVEKGSIILPRIQFPMFKTRDNDDDDGDDDDD